LPRNASTVLSPISPLIVSAPRPDNEDERLAALHRLDILDTEPEALFDRITTLAQSIFGVSSAAVSLVDRDRQWFKSMCGLDLRETPREQSICTHAILEDGVFVVEDAAADDRFAHDPLVEAGDLRFYAGAPLYVEEASIGTLCLIDDQPRPFGDEEAGMLSALAEVVVDLLEARRTTHQIQYLRSALEETRDAVVITEGAPLDAPGPRIVWSNEAFSRMTGYEAKELIGRTPRILQGPETDQSVLNKVRSALENERAVHAETVNYRKDGTPYVVDWHIAPVHTEDEALTHWVSIQRDITDQQRRRERLRHEATHDALTGLPNRYAVQEKIQELIDDADDRHVGALLYLDLDRFKPVNDELGHQVGDRVLVRTAEGLRAVLRRQDTIGRIGGDEFVVCLPDLSTPEEARSIADRLHDTLCRPFQVGPHEVQVDVSIGGTVRLADYDTADAALHVADMAMYEAKDDPQRTTVLWTRAQGQDRQTASPPPQEPASTAAPERPLSSGPASP
jgi:diguanylate cyclase (GGDEF)-like protein/PAS domain S-box-containing protein